MKLNKAVCIGSLSFFVVVLTQLFSFIIGIYAANILTLSQYGTLGLIKYIMQYAPLYAMGIPQALMYIIPKQIGSKKAKLVLFNKKLLFTISFASSLFFLLFFLFYMFNIKLNGIPLNETWILISLTIVSTSLSGFAIFIYRVDMSFLRLSYIRLIYTVVFVVSIFFLLKQYQLNGFLFSMILANITMFIYFLYHKNDFKFGFAWKINKIKSYIKFGFPIRLNSLLWSLFLSIDLWMVSCFIGSKEAGLYALLTLVVTAFDVLPSILREFLVPKIARKFRYIQKSKDDLRVFIFKSNEIFLLVAFSMQMIVYLFFSLLIELYLTKYAEIVYIIPIILFGNFVGSIRFMLGDILILLKRQKTILYINFVLFVVVLVLDFIAAYYFQSLVWIAVSTSLGIAALGIIEYIYLFHILKIDINFGLKYIAVLLISIILINLNDMIASSELFYFSFILPSIVLYLAYNKFRVFWTLLSKDN